MNPELETLALSHSLTYYDLLAVLCRYIHALDNGTKRDLYKLLCSNLSECVRKATETFTWLSSPLFYRNVGSEVLEDVEWLVEKSSDFYLLLGTVCQMDIMLSGQKNLDTFLQGRQCPIITCDSGDSGVSQMVYRFEALNCSTMNRYGILLPRFLCEWDRPGNRSVADTAQEPLGALLKNHIWVPKDRHWKVWHLYCDMRKAGTNMASFKQVRPFRVVSSPLSCRAPFVAELNQQRQTCCPHYIDSEDGSLKARFKNVIDYAIAERADIVLFPEMMGTAASLAFCQQYIADNMAVHRPKLTILPSHESEVDGVWQNSLYILDENGDCIFRYNKKHPFRYDFDSKDDSNGGKIERVSYFEPIKDDGQACVIHVPGIGRIGILICSDLFLEGYLEMLTKDVKITLLLYPVYTSGKERIIRDLSTARQYGCDVIMCNTCAAWDDNLTPMLERKENADYDAGFIHGYFAYGHKLGPPGAVEQLAMVDCKGMPCGGCVFLEDIPKRYDGRLLPPLQIRREER